MYLSNITFSVCDFERHTFILLFNCTWNFQVRRTRCYRSSAAKLSHSQLHGCGFLRYHSALWNSLQLNLAVVKFLSSFKSPQFTKASRIFSRYQLNRVFKAILAPDALWSVGQLDWGGHAVESIGRCDMEISQFFVVNMTVIWLDRLSGVWNHIIFICGWFDWPSNWQNLMRTVMYY